MRKLIQALTIATLLQIAGTTGLTFFMLDRNLSASRDYALMVEQRANEHTGEVTLALYNRLQQERNSDRDEMRGYIDQAITLRLTRAGLPLGLPQEPQ